MVKGGGGDKYDWFHENAAFPLKRAKNRLRQLQSRNL